MRRQRVFFYVQHLLGVGHVFRAARIARGLVNAGFDVDLVMGGLSFPGLGMTGINAIQLVPLKASEQGFNSLITETGRPLDAEVMAQRSQQLLNAFCLAQPDVVLIEAFPFGRRQMRFELIPLLEAARNSKHRPVMACSIRDILQESGRTVRAQEAVDLLRRYFDCVVVHGDPNMVRLEATFTLASEIEDLVCYSGIIAPSLPPWLGLVPHIADVIVSAGGGAVGRNLLRTAIAAKAKTRLRSLRWLVVVGPNAKPDEVSKLMNEAMVCDVRIERFVSDLASVLTKARLSISQAGYNTVADILVARCKAVYVPFSGAGETEQTRRATLLEKHGFCVAVDENDLCPDTLAAAVDDTIGRPLPDLGIDLGGVRRTADILSALVRDGIECARKYSC